MTEKWEEEKAVRWEIEWIFYPLNLQDNVRLSPFLSHNKENISLLHGEAINYS